MNSRALCKLASRLMRHPAAPYHEHAVRAEVEMICQEHNLSHKRDPFGNLLIGAAVSERAKAQSSRPIVFAAHMDHPGFEVLSGNSSNGLQARFRGGVPDQYFRSGLAIRLMPGGERARLGRRIGKDRIFEIRDRKTRSSKPSFAVWDLEDFSVRGNRIHGRACDDLIGVACALAAVIELRKGGPRVNAVAAISRAEEIGFLGALALSRSRLLPKNSLIISLETSSELPGVKMGQGVILRVGDRTSVFDSKAMRFLREVAAGVTVKRRRFQFQRGLMSGGTCEATAYQEYGYQTGAVCVALGNYHNCSARNRIAAEYVDISDACAMVDLLVEAGRAMSRFDSIIRGLPQRLEKLRQEAVSRLRATR